MLLIKNYNHRHTLLKPSHSIDLRAFPSHFLIPIPFAVNMFILDLFLRCVFVSGPSGQFSLGEAGVSSIGVCSSFMEGIPYIFLSCFGITGIEDRCGISEFGKAISTILRSRSLIKMTKAIFNGLIGSSWESAQKPQ